MTELNLKNLIKFIKDKSTLIIFLLGFLIVIMIAFNLLLNSLIKQRSQGKITNEAASTQVGFDSFESSIEKINKANTIQEDKVYDKVAEKVDEMQTEDASSYVAQLGDSSWKIAEKFFGSGSRYLEIEKLNNFKHGQYLQIGQVILINANLNIINKKILNSDGIKSDDRDWADTESYIVKPGDSVWKIAFENYSDPMIWSEIYELNKQVIGTDPNLIFPLTELKLPVIKSRL